MVIPLASLATPQTRGFAATLRAGVCLSASLCRQPLVVNDTTARLASEQGCCRFSGFTTLAYSLQVRSALK